MLIRTLKDDEDIGALTELLHRAYAALAAAGLRYTATHQTSEVTRLRLSRGHPFIAELDGRVVGTATCYPPDPENILSWYRDENAFHFGQFGVDPEYQGRGVGQALHQALIDHALGGGAHYLLLDTAAPAHDLIAMYHRWGYVVVDRFDYASTNYESVITRKRLIP